MLHLIILLSALMGITCNASEEQNMPVKITAIPVNNGMQTLIPGELCTCDYNDAEQKLIITKVEDADVPIESLVRAEMTFLNEEKTVVQFARACNPLIVRTGFCNGEKCGLFGSVEERISSVECVDAIHQNRAMLCDYGKGLQALVFDANEKGQPDCSICSAIQHFVFKLASMRHWFFALLTPEKRKELYGSSSPHLFRPE